MDDVIINYENLTFSMRNLTESIRTAIDKQSTEKTIEQNVKRRHNWLGQAQMKSQKQIETFIEQGCKGFLRKRQYKTCDHCELSVINFRKIV